jgi:hypothetical protein
MQPSKQCTGSSRERAIHNYSEFYTYLPSLQSADAAGSPSGDYPSASCSSETNHYAKSRDLFHQPGAHLFRLDESGDIEVEKRVRVG